MKRMLFIVIVLPLLLTGCRSNMEEKVKSEPKKEKQIQQSFEKEQKEKEQKEKEQKEKEQKEKDQMFSLEQLPEELAVDSSQGFHFRIRNASDKTYEEVETAIEKKIDGNWIVERTGIFHHGETYRERKERGCPPPVRTLNFMTGPILPNDDFILEISFFELELDRQKEYRIKATFVEVSGGEEVPDVEPVVLIVNIEI